MKFLQTQMRSNLDNSLHEKLITIEASLPEIEKQLSEIDISRDQKAYAEMATLGRANNEQKKYLKKHVINFLLRIRSMQ